MILVLKRLSLRKSATKRFQWNLWRKQAFVYFIIPFYVRDTPQLVLTYHWCKWESCVGQERVYKWLNINNGYIGQCCQIFAVWSILLRLFYLEKVFQLSNICKHVWTNRLYSWQINGLLIYVARSWRLWQ